MDGGSGEVVVVVVQAHRKNRRKIECSFWFFSSIIYFVSMDFFIFPKLVVIVGAGIDNVLDIGISS